MSSLGAVKSNLLKCYAVSNGTLCPRWGDVPPTSGSTNPNLLRLLECLPVCTLTAFHTPDSKEMAIAKNIFLFMINAKEDSFTGVLKSP